MAGHSRLITRPEGEERGGVSPEGQPRTGRGGEGGGGLVVGPRGGALDAAKCGGLYVICRFHWSVSRWFHHAYLYWLTSEMFLFILKWPVTPYVI